jgi:hypothetical protein
MALGASERAAVSRVQSGKFRHSGGRVRSERPAGDWILGQHMPNISETSFLFSRGRPAFHRWAWPQDRGVVATTGSSQAVLSNYKVNISPKRRH